MTLPTSGPISLGAINSEFALGNNIGAYRGVRWYKDDNTRGYFDGGSGNMAPTDFSEFYGKRKTIPVSPSGPTALSNGAYYTIPFYNKLTFVITGGQAGGQGPNGWNGEGNYPTPGSNGNGGGTSSFGSYSASGGSPNSGAGSTRTIIYDANNNTTSDNGSVTSGCPLKDASFLVTVGSGGSGGRGGYNRVYRDFPYPFDYLDGWYNEDNANFGSTGASGSVTVKVE